VRASGGDAGRIGPACERLGLTGRLFKTSASKLSAGQRRRVALAVLTARWPELWLLDEPHAGLDASARQTLNELIGEAKSSGVTVVIASHEAGFVDALATRAVTVTGGRITGDRLLGVAPPRPRPPPRTTRAGRSRRLDRSPTRPSVPTRRWPMWRDTLLVAGKDLRIEARSRVGLSQVAPFGVIALVMFAFALGPDRSPMAKGAPGLFWVAVLFCTVLAVQRSVVGGVGRRGQGRPPDVGTRPGRTVPGQGGGRGRPAGGARTGARTGAVLLYGARIEVPWLIVASCVLGTIGLAATGTLYGALSAGLRVRETLLPFLFLPIAAPVLLAGTRIWQAGLSGGVSSDATQWLRLLLVFDAVYLAIGIIVYGPIQESA